MTRTTFEVDYKPHRGSAWKPWSQCGTHVGALAEYEELRDNPAVPSVRLRKVVSSVETMMEATK